MREPWHMKKPFGVLTLVAVALWGLAVDGGTTREAVAQMGSALIGRLEGPEVILDPARFPTTFNDACASRRPATPAGHREIEARLVNELVPLNGQWLQ